MKRFCALGVVFACSMGGVFATEEKSSSAPAPEFSTMQWLSRVKKSLGKTIGAGVAGVGGLVGTGFVIKKIVRVAKEAIALKKQLQVNPKDMSLRKKRRALIRKAIGLGIGGLVLGALSVRAVFYTGKSFNNARKSYSRFRNLGHIQKNYDEISLAQASAKRLLVSSRNKQSWNAAGQFVTLVPKVRRAPQEGDSIRYADADPSVSNGIVYRNNDWDFGLASDRLGMEYITEREWYNMGFTQESLKAFVDAQQVSH